MKVGDLVMDLAEQDLAIIINVSPPTDWTDEGATTYLLHVATGVYLGSTMKVWGDEEFSLVSEVKKSLNTLEPPASKG